MGSSRTQRLALAAALVTVALWASAFVGIRAADRALAPGSLALARLIVGGTALSLLVLTRREPLPRRGDLPGLLVCGLFWFAAYNVLLNQAERMVDAGTASLLVNVGPVLIALLSGLFLREGFPRRLFIGCAVAFSGAVIIGLATSSHGLEAGVGAVLCVAAAAAYAAGVTAEKPLLSRSSALTVTWSACVIGAIACLPFAPQLAHDLARADTGSIVWTVYLGLAPTALGFSLWAFALARTSAGRMGATTYLVPPIAIVMGWLLLGDVPPWLAIAGGIPCIAGVAIARGARLPARRRVRAVPSDAQPLALAGEAADT